MLGSEPYSSLTLNHGGKAIRWVSGAYSVPDTATVDWIKSASTVKKKGDVDEYAHLMWSRCLDLTLLGLQDFWDFFPRTQFPLLPLLPLLPLPSFLSFIVRRFRRKGSWNPRVNTELNGHSSRATYQRSIGQKGGQEHTKKCELGQRGTQYARYSMTKVAQ